MSKKILIAAVTVFSLTFLDCDTSGSSSSETDKSCEQMFICSNCSNASIEACCLKVNNNPANCSYATCGQTWQCNNADCSQATQAVVGFCGLEGCQDQFPCAKCANQIVTLCCTAAGCYYTACGQQYNCNGLFCAAASQNVMNYCAN